MKRLLLLSLFIIVSCSSEKQNPRFEKSFTVYCVSIPTRGIGQRIINGRDKYHLLRQFDSQTQTGKQITFRTQIELKKNINEVYTPVVYSDGWGTREYEIRPHHDRNKDRGEWVLSKGIFYTKKYLDGETPDNLSLTDNILKQKIGLYDGECKSITNDQYTSLKDEYLTIFKNFAANKTKYFYSKQTASTVEQINGQWKSFQGKEVWILRDEYLYNSFEDYQIKAPQTID